MSKPSNKNPKIPASEILEQLDACAEAFDFPMLDNVSFHHADIRLTAFRSASEWLIVFEEIALFQGQTFVNAVSAYGNRLQKPGTQLAVDNLIEPAPNHPIWDNEGNFLLDPDNFEIVINGRSKSFTPSPADYKKAGVKPGSDMPAPAKILRLLTFLMPAEFFLDDKRLLSICNREGSSLNRFLQLEDWHHPDVADEEMPSESVCFQSLATAISKGDPGMYVCPEKMVNTHWTNWV